MRSAKESPLKTNVLCKDINDAWRLGWFDEYTEEHFLIRAINKRFSEFMAYQHVDNNSPHMYNFDDNFCGNFVINFSAKIAMLRHYIGDQNTERFMRDQVSAGKENYDEAQFFRALSEINIIRHYCSFNNRKPKNILYEPLLGRSKKNPEIRIEYEDGFLIDIEVKTPGFPQKAGGDDIILPTILLDVAGRKALSDWCHTHGKTFLLPRVLKIKEYINSATEKFQNPINNRHFNLLFINWTYSDFPSRGYLEGYSLLSNDDNGIFNKKEYGLSIGIDPSAFEKISAIIIYSGSLEEIIFQDFRFLWATRNFAIVPNRYLIEDHAHHTSLASATGMDYKKNIRPPKIMIEKGFAEGYEGMKKFVDLLAIVEEHKLVIH